MPSPFPNKTEMLGLDWLPVITSSLPSWLKSPATIGKGLSLVALVAEAVIALDTCGGMTEKKMVFEVPPFGGGFTAVIATVPAAATLADGTAAVTSWLFRKVVASGEPFQSITVLLTKPSPFTFSVKPEDPGCTEVGPRGC